MTKKYLGWTLLWIVIVGGMVTAAIVYPDVFRHQKASEHMEQTDDTGGAAQSTGSTFDSAALKKQLNSSTIVIPDSTISVTFDDGNAAFTDGPSQGVVVLGDVLAVQKTDHGQDALVELAVNYGGTGTFTYLVVYKVHGTEVRYSDSLFIGDRIRLETVSTTAASDGVYEVRVQYLDRKPDEPMAVLPTVKKNLTARVHEHTFNK